MKSVIKIILGSKGILKSKGEVDPGIVLGLILTLIAIGLAIWFVVKNMAAVQP